VASDALAQVQDDSELEQLANKVVTDNAAKIEDYRFGSEGISKFFIGQGMKASKGRANPQILNKKLGQKLKEKHERAVADSFFERYNALKAASYQFVQIGKPPEPDLIFGDASGGTVGVEITSTYLNQEEAKWASDQARGADTSPLWASGVISQPDEVYAGQLLNAISRKLPKTYPVQPTWLVVDFNYPLGDAVEAAELVRQVGARVRQVGIGPFAEIWAVWRVTNVPEVRFEIFKVC
jgi:hypothetical protein